MKQTAGSYRSHRFVQFVFAILAASVLLPAHSALAQSTAPQYGADPKATESYRKSMEAADQKIAGEVKAHSELMKNEEYLTTQIGPRLTGSPQMQAASQWTLRRVFVPHAHGHFVWAPVSHFASLFRHALDTHST